MGMADDHYVDDLIAAEERERLEFQEAVVKWDEWLMNEQDDFYACLIYRVLAKNLDNFDPKFLAKSIAETYKELQNE